MQVPFDDKGIHQGHSIFDTCNIASGKIYALDFHLERFARSIELAQISSAPPISVIKSIIMQTCAAAVQAAGDDTAGSVRFWMSMGQGNISAKEQWLGTKPCLFYVQVGGLGQSQLQQRGHEGSDFSGMSAADMKVASITTDLVPMKPGMLAKCKSTNYMLNSLNHLEAAKQGAEAGGVWIGQDGLVKEGAYANYAFVTQDDELVTPPFDDILSGTSVRRAMVLAEQLLEEQGQPLNAISVRPISVEEAKGSKEMMVLGGSFVRPVTQWDDHVYLDGKPGPVTCRLAELVQDDMDNDAQSIIAAGVDTDAIIDHDGSRSEMKWENIPLSEVFESALAEAEVEAVSARL
jgi:4-amino-4-deoxychorismate lyase